MNFPLDNPIFQFLYWLVNTPGLGGLFVALIVIISVSAYGSALRWIARGAQADELETYAYPTPALHEHI
jgi:hypothetical protein